MAEATYIHMIHKSLDGDLEPVTTFRENAGTIYPIIQDLLEITHPLQPRQIGRLLHRSLHGSKRVQPDHQPLITRTAIEIRETARTGEEFNVYSMNLADALEELGINYTEILVGTKPLQMTRMPGHLFTGSDRDLAVQAYLSFVESCVERVNGKIKFTEPEL